MIMIDMQGVEFFVYIPVLISTQTVITSKGVKIRLRKEIASGAEGNIYEFEVVPKKSDSERKISSDQYLCKIYKKNKYDARTLRSLEPQIPIIANIGIKTLSKKI